MKINTKKNYSEARWFTKPTGAEAVADDPKFLVRPFPASKEEFVGRRDGTMVLTGKNLYDKFSYCLVAWENINGDDDQPLKLTEAVKQVVFDNGLGGIPAFVSECLNKIAEEKEELEKN